MTIDIIVVLLLILLNGFFALAEMAVVASRRARLKQLARSNRRAAVAAQLVDDPGRFLSTVQIGITLIGVLAGAFSGATIAERIAASLQDVPWLAPYRHAIGIGLVVAAITYLSLIFGELVPKRLALGDPERIATAVARPMRLLSRIAAPAVSLLTWSSEAVVRLLGLHRRKRAGVTEEEIRLMVEEGAQAGVIERVERDMVNRIFRLGDKSVDEIMTPRTQLVWLDATASPEANLARMRESPHSRFPVQRGAEGETIGFVLAKDLATRLAGPAPADLLSALKPSTFVPETAPVFGLLDTFKTTGLDAALVVDEYGVVQGLVTLHDILEAIVGEVAVRAQLGAQAVVRRADGSYLIDGMLAADEAREALGLHQLPGEDEHDFNTLAGMMVANLGRIPSPGDHFDWLGWRFEVVDMDGTRVDKVLAVPPPTTGEEIP